MRCFLFLYVSFEIVFVSLPVATHIRWIAYSKVYKKATIICGMERNNERFQTISIFKLKHG